MVMDSSGGETMAVGTKLPAESLIAKSLDNIVGNLWQQSQARHDSSGSSAGNQSPRNGDDLSDGEPLETEERSHTPPPRMDSPEDNLTPQLKVKDRRDLLKDDDATSESSDPRDILKDPRAILAGLPPLPALEAFNRQTRDFLNSPQALLANLKQFGNGPPSGPLNPLSLPPSSLGPLPPLPRPPSQPPTPNSQRSSPTGGAGGGSNQGNWSFEEQFKQLYEIDDNPKRREFLDDLFSMMQKRGTPINRLPIMAKQVLDLYELYNLVLARGGLVEVINKKQWQEVIKGLGLPSSITSAAFTLRTQYTKYLYPLECRLKNIPNSIDIQSSISSHSRYTKYLYPLECYKRNLSNPNDLQAAVEGNKREGRRSSYGAYPELSQLQHQLIGGPPPGFMTSQISPMQLPGQPLTAGHIRPPHMNGNGSIHPPMPPTSGSSPGPGGDPLSALEMTRLALWKMYNQAGSDLPKIPGVTSGMPSNFPSIPGLQHAAADLIKAQQDKAFDMQMAERQKMALEAVAIETAAREAADRKEALELKEAQRRLNNDSNDNHTSSGEDDLIIDRERRESGHGHNGVNGQRDSRGSVPPHGRDNDDIIGQDDILEGEEDNYDETSSMSPPAAKRLRHGSHDELRRARDRECNDNERESDEPSPRKRPAPGYNTTSLNASGLPGANIKISSRNDGRNGDSSLVVSLEINGTNYQGVLFAQSAKRRSS